MRGVNFELALFLAQLTGAAIYSDQRLTRDDLTAAHLADTDGGVGADHTLTLELALALHPEKIRLAREAPTAQAVRASLRALFAAGLAQGEAPDATTVEAALARVKATTVADLPEVKGPAEPAGQYEDTVFEIDAQLIVPAHGYGPDRSTPLPDRLRAPTTHELCATRGSLRARGPSRRRGSAVRTPRGLSDPVFGSPPREGPDAH